MVLARVRAQIDLKRARDLLNNQNAWLEAEVARRMNEILLIQDLNIRALACLGETRDNETGQHIVRTQGYVEVLARHLAEHPRFHAALASPRLVMVVKAAPLHDIGKVRIPLEILTKPGKLTPQERRLMNCHPQDGARLLLQSDDDMEMPAIVAYEHHIMLNGGGYPALHYNRACTTASASTCQRVAEASRSHAVAAPCAPKTAVTSDASG